MVQHDSTTGMIQWLSTVMIDMDSPIRFTYSKSLDHFKPKMTFFVGPPGSPSGTSGASGADVPHLDWTWASWVFHLQVSVGSDQRCGFPTSLAFGFFCVGPNLKSRVICRWNTRTSDISSHHQSQRSSVRACLQATRCRRIHSGISATISDAFWTCIYTRT